MRLKPCLYTLVFLALFLTGCASSKNDVPPSQTDLLARTWVFNTITIQTDAKVYAINATQEELVGENNTVTLAKDGTYTYRRSGKPITGRWLLTNDKTLTLTDADNSRTIWTINTLTATSLDLATMTVNLTKGSDLTNTNVYTPEESSVAISSVFLLASLDKQYGGTIDFTEEPTPRSVQIMLKGTAR
ncbi:hypothetical protein GCM10027578_03650 [Spirosoma luteolum]